jgi:hypothetical protein
MVDGRGSLDKDPFSCSSGRALSNAFKRNASPAYVFPFSSSESDKLEAITGSVAISDARRQAQCTAWQGYLLMNSFTNRQIAAGTDAGSAFPQVNRLTVNIGGRVFEKDPNPNFLLKGITGEATPNSVIREFQFSGHLCVWNARLLKCYAAIGNQA